MPTLRDRTRSKNGCNAIPRRVEGKWLPARENAVVRGSFFNSKTQSIRAL